MGVKSVILCDKKTGSTFLQNAIDSHPNITCYDEMFLINHSNNRRSGQFIYKHMKKTKRMKVIDYLKWLYSQEENVAFRLIYEHCGHWKVMNHLIDLKVPIIHLIRQNFLKKAISKLTLGKVRLEKIDIKTQDIINCIAESHSKLKKYNKILKKSGLPIITVYYEDMFGEKEGEETNIKKLGGSNITSDAITYLNEKYSKQICNLFKVEQLPLYCNVAKKNREDVVERLVNKEEVIQELRKRKWEKYLEI